MPKQQRAIEEDLHIIYKGDVRALSRAKKVVGLGKRCIARDDQTAVDLALAGCERMLKDYDRSRIGVLVFVTQTPNYMIPNNASVLHGKLGLNPECIILDINQACQGFVYGLLCTYGILNVVDGEKSALLICGDTISKVIKNDDASLAGMMGDGIGACLIDKTEEEITTCFSMQSSGTKFNYLITPNMGTRSGYGEINDGEADLDSVRKNSGFLYMNGAGVFAYALGAVPHGIRRVMGLAELKEEDIEYYFLHQANKYLIENIVRNMGVDHGKVPNDITTKYGNLSGASIPCAMCEHISRDREFDVVMCGFGAGMSCASCTTKITRGFQNHGILFVD